MIRKKICAKICRIGVVVLAVSVLYGCEHVALIGRPTLEGRGGPRQVTATVNGIDHGLREIYLRAASDQHYVVNYTADTRVLADGREYGARGLKLGDRVRVALREGDDKRLYAEEIRVDSAAAPGPIGVSAVEGTVESILPERGVLELRVLSGDLLTIYVPESANEATRSRFRRIRVGDYVRLEGERLGEHRLELLAFR
jgi:hypothetical protein